LFPCSNCVVITYKQIYDDGDDDDDVNGDDGDDDDDDVSDNCGNK